MRRSSIFLLLGAVLLGLLAVLAARMFLVPEGGPRKAAVPMSTVVVAKQPLKFGDKITADKVLTIEWPGALPADAYKAPGDAVGDGNRTALREIKANEIILATAVTGGAGRLASSTLLGPDMRAVAVPLNETAGAGGFLAPGDRVDVLVSKSFEDEVSVTTAVVQGARVLAVGQNSDTSNSEPNVAKSATIEVTPDEAQKVALAQTVGTVMLALRSTGDEAQMPLRASTALDLFGGYARAKPAPREAAAPGAAPAGPPRPPKPTGPQVSVVRGTETTSYQVPR
jgi:pilus assembly protein CpaB